jgi:hypothetical protein
MCVFDQRLVSRFRLLTDPGNESRTTPVLIAVRLPASARAGSACAPTSGSMAGTRRRRGRPSAPLPGSAAGAGRLHGLGECAAPWLRGLGRERRARPVRPAANTVAQVKVRREGRFLMGDVIPELRSSSPLPRPVLASAVPPRLRRVQRSAALCNRVSPKSAPPPVLPRSNSFVLAQELQPGR